MKRTERGILIEGKQGITELSVLSESIIRVQKRVDGQGASEELILTGSLHPYDAWTVQEMPDVVRVETRKLCAAYSFDDDSLWFYRNGGGEILREKEARFVRNSEENGWTGSVEQIFVSAEDEVLGGLGQQADGACNYKGRFVHLNQFNIISAVPVLVSTNGYGQLLPDGA
ncbi:MAG TPA: DUF4968 domain-containing protein [Candidatus Eisenbergiella stercoravium]|nr:DUF4968 domain-containing protein [Candidatus Eisenbergiella stercoravium]